MEFFNRKEEVIDIKLTQYGRKKYAEGKFSPKYYSFSDEDVIYDASYFGIAEPEHSASVRIKDAVRLKLASSTLGIESTIENPVQVQQDIEKYYSHTKRITNSDPNSDYAPAGKVKSYCGGISNHSLQKSIEGREPVNIPQLTLENLKYKLTRIEDANEEQRFFGIEQEDGSYLTINREDGEFLFSFEEENALSMEEKFDIQIFEVEVNEEGKELLHELKFKKEPKRIVDGLYQDNVVEEEEQDETYASSRFSVECDYEIDQQFMKKRVGDQVAIMRQGEIRRVQDSENFSTPDDQEVENLRNISLDDIATLTTEQLRERANVQSTVTTSAYDGISSNTPEVDD